MTESLARALATLDRIDAGPPLDESDELGLVEAAHCDIARGLGLTVYDPSNFPYITVSDRADADPYADVREVWELPDYSASLADALTLKPPGFALVLQEVGSRWKAACKLEDQAYPRESAWKESSSPVRAIARAALFARLDG